MIELAGRLVVPAAPRLTAVDADDRALVDAGEQTLGLMRIDPDELEIVAARCAGERLERSAAIGRPIERRLRDVDEIRIARVGNDTDRHDARIVVRARPCLAGIFGSIESVAQSREDDAAA